MKQALSLLALAFAAAACAPQGHSASCKDSYQRPDVAALTHTLADAQSRWKASGPEHYRYALNYAGSGEISGTHEVEVRRGQIVAGGTDGQDKSMDDLLADVGKMLAEAAAPQSCVMVQASYDPTDGHMTQFSYQNAEEGLMDAFGGYRITHWQPIPTAAPRTNP